MRNLTCCLLYLVLTVLVAGATAAAQSERPNVIVIVADDLGYGDLGCFGQQTIATPRLDALARQGLRLTDFYAGNTVCRPSRLVLWTGLHPGHQPINDNQKYEFSPEDITLAERVRAAGYVTAGFGKWAMGGVDSPGHPNQNGFDLWFGYLDQSEAHNYYPTHLWRNEQKIPLAGNVLLENPQARGRVAEKKVTYAHDVITDAALSFLRVHAEDPFLMHVHWTIPHANNEAGRVSGDGMEVPTYGRYADRRWPNPEKGFAAMVTRMDRDVGRIVDLLQELKIAKRTIVFFTSDNGPHREGGHHENFFNSNGALQGHKRSLHEAGIRVPTIAWSPEFVIPGSDCDTPLAFWDLLPTICELTGAESPPTDGVSFVNALRHRPQETHKFLFFRFNKQIAVRDGVWKGIRKAPTAEWELYNLRHDEGEVHNIAAKHPAIVARLQLFAEEAETRSP